VFANREQTPFRKSFIPAVYSLVQMYIYFFTHCTALHHICRSRETPNIEHVLDFRGDRIQEQGSKSDLQGKMTLTAPKDANEPKQLAFPLVVIQLPIDSSYNMFSMDAVTRKI